MSWIKRINKREKDIPGRREKHAWKSMVCSWLVWSGNWLEYQRKGEKNIETIVSHFIKWLRGAKRVIRWDGKVEMMWFMCNSHISNTSVIKQQSYHTLSCPFIHQVSKMLTIVIKITELMLFNSRRHPSHFILQ